MNAPGADHVVVGGGLAGLWLARALLAAGRSVTLIERGSLRHADEKAAEPPLSFPERVNVGALQARHHVLTGNGSVWGGALVRNDPESLGAMFDEDSEEALQAWARDYERLEARLGVPATRRFVREDLPGAPRVCELNVLPGRRRNLARSMLDACRSDPRFALRCPAEVIALDRERSGAIRSITVRDAGGATDVRARRFVLCTGVVDANLFARRHLAAIIDLPGRPTGTRLHDHWSLPIGKLRWRGGAGMDWLYPPTFRGGCVQGRRAEIVAEMPWGRRAGFIHLQAHYDLVEPYATIKRWMSARQQGKGWSEQAGFALDLARHAPSLARIGWRRYRHSALFVPDGMEIDVVLDFESDASDDNRIELDASSARLYWNVRERDVAAFATLGARACDDVATWARSAGLPFEPLVDPRDAAAAASALEERATDAYHLGGGLEAGRDPRRAFTTPDGTFHRIPNLAVIGTAAFARPGLANPVATLLAMSESYCRRLD